MKNDWHVYIDGTWREKKKGDEMSRAVRAEAFLNADKSRAHWLTATGDSGYSDTEGLTWAMMAAELSVFRGLYKQDKEVAHALWRLVDAIANGGRTAESVGVCVREVVRHIKEIWGEP